MDSRTELSQLQSALAAARAQLSDLTGGPGLSAAQTALCAGTPLSEAQKATLAYWEQVVAQERDLAQRTKECADSQKPASQRSSEPEAKSSGSKRKDLIAEAVARPDPAGLHWHWLRPNAVGHHKAGSVDTAACDQHQRATKQLRLAQEVNQELQRPCCDIATRERLRASGTPEAAQLADV